MADIFQTSVSGLLAFQRALATTSHNISNLNTPGYSRQEAVFATRSPNLEGGNWIGTGVDVANIRRLVDESRLQAVRSNTSEFERLSAFAGLNGRIDSMMADADAGLAPALQAFFDSVQQAAADPSSRTARQLVLTEGGNLATRLGYFDTRLRELDTEVNHRISLSVDAINQHADSIARLNREIVVSYGGSQGSPPNDLLDQRDELIRQLSELVGTRVVAEPTGAVNVFIGNGQSLVLGQEVNRLSVITDPADTSEPKQNQVGFVAGGATVNITANIAGGALTGLLDFRRESLSATRADLSTLAQELADAFNAQHALGASSDGSTLSRGEPFFGYDPANPLSSFELIASDPDRIAWANPAVVGEALDNGQANNLGSGKIANPAVSADVDLAAFSASGGVRLEYIGGSPGSFMINGDATNTVAYDPSDPQPITVPIAGGTVTVEMSGEPRVGDAFVIEPNIAGAGDGSNLHALAALDNARNMPGNTSFQEFYGSLVGRVGTQTLRANVNRDAQESLLNQAVAARNEVSGVNLEEEAANMLRYQQAFQASAQLVTVANSLFQSLLSAVGR